MSEPKLLHHERVIQFSGILMMMSPFVNFILSIYPVQVANKWTWPVLSMLIKGISLPHWILWSASFVVGSMMLKGRRSSWISVLILEGLFIVFQLANFRSQMQRGWFQPSFLLLTNISVFVLVYVQEFRQSAGLTFTPKKVENKSQPISQPPLASAFNPPAVEFEVDISSLIGSVVDFEGIGPWAEVSRVENERVVLRGLSSPPLGIENKQVQIATDEFVLNLKYEFKNNEEYTFYCESCDLLPRTQVA